MKPSRRVLIKLGGAALQSEDALALSTNAIRSLTAEGCEVLMVHGGGPAINEQLRLQGIEWTFVGGQRVTTPKMMDTIEATLCGQVNKRLVRHFCAQGLRAFGVSGIDNQTLICKPAAPELGQVGLIENVNTAWIESILALPEKLLPIIAPVGASADGKSFNINADWAAVHLAVALKVDELLFLTDQNGILDEEGLNIRNVDANGLRNMIEAHTVTGGMLTKTLAVLHALENGVPRVRIGKCDQADGTTCRLHNEPRSQEKRPDATV